MSDTYTARALAQLAGAWTGESKMRLMPDDPYTTSPATAVVRPAARASLVTVSYTWSGDGAEQDGLIVFGDGAEPGAVVAVWCDSWHQSPQWMTCTGRVDGSGIVTVAGSYGPPDDHVGWRITLDPGPADGDTFRVTMHNVMPDLDYPVVEASYRRSPTG